MRPATGSAWRFALKIIRLPSRQNRVHVHTIFENCANPGHIGTMKWMCQMETNGNGGPEDLAAERDHQATEVGDPIG